MDRDTRKCYRHLLDGEEVPEELETLHDELTVMAAKLNKKRLGVDTMVLLAHRCQKELSTRPQQEPTPVAKPVAGPKPPASLQAKRDRMAHARAARGKKPEMAKG